jgi:hypothetical protein
LIIDNENTGSAIPLLIDGQFSDINDKDLKEKNEKGVRGYSGRTNVLSI